MMNRKSVVNCNCHKGRFFAIGTPSRPGACRGAGARYRPTRIEPAVLKEASGSGVAARKRLASAVRAFAISAGCKKRYFWRSSTWPAAAPAGRVALGPGRPSRGRRY